MGKKLLTKDYDKIVLEGLLLPEKDVFKYYSNLMEENHPDKPEMFTELKNDLNKRIEWYRQRVHGGRVQVKMQDGTTKLLDRDQIGESDEDGNTTWHDVEENEIYLLPLYSDRNVRVNRIYFENQLKVIENIAELEKKNKNLCA